MNIRCLIADDEPLAQKLITEYLSQIPHLRLTGTCKRATDISGFSGQFDLLFLDIRMPGLTGLEFLRSLPVRPMVIMITAYSEHALEGYDLDVVDYLVKPVAFERFLQAVNKATRIFNLEHHAGAPAATNLIAEPARDQAEKDYLFVKSGHKSVRVNFDDILYIEGLREYIGIHTADGRKYLRLGSMKEFEKIVSPAKFLRIHKSYIVATRKVTAHYGNTVEIGAISLPVGRIYKEEVGRRLS